MKEVPAKLANTAKVILGCVDRNKWDEPRFLGQGPKTFCSNRTKLRIPNLEAELDGNQGGKNLKTVTLEKQLKELVMCRPRVGETHDSCLSPII